MKGASDKLVALAYTADSVSMLISIRKQVILSFTANKTCLGSSLYLVDFEVIKPLDMSDEVIFFGRLSLSAGQMVSIVIVSSVCEYSILAEISLGRSQHDSVSETNCCLSHKVFIEVLHLLWLPELGREHILVTISDAAPTMLIETPLVELSILSDSSNVILVNIHIYELDSIGVISSSSEDRLSLDIFSATESSLAVEASSPQLVDSEVFDDDQCHDTVSSGNLDCLDTLSKVNLLKLIQIRDVKLRQHAVARTE